MLIACWSTKGGSGTTVVSVALSLLLARRSPGRVVLADLAGDVPAVLGLPQPAGPGLSDWAAAGPEVPADALDRLAVPAAPGLRLLPRGGCPWPDDAAAADRLTAALARSLPTWERPVTAGPPPAAGPASTAVAAPRRAAGARAPAPGPAVVAPSDGGVVTVADCGTFGGPGAVPAGPALAAGAGLSLLVIRPCFLALRRAVAAPLRPSAVVLVDELGRSLGADDVAEVLGVPVRAVVPHDPTVARAVDAGVLAARLPRLLERALRAVT